MASSWSPEDSESSLLKTCSHPGATRSAGQLQRAVLFLSSKLRSEAFVSMCVGSYGAGRYREVVLAYGLFLKTGLHHRPYPKQDGKGQKSVVT